METTLHVLNSMHDNLKFEWYWYVNDIIAIFVKKQQ